MPTTLVVGPARSPPAIPLLSTSPGGSVRNAVPVFTIVVLCVGLPRGAAPPSIDFNATVSSLALRPAGVCATGAFRCGTADIEGFDDAAEWQFFFGTFVPTSQACGDYTATVVFT